MTLNKACLILGLSFLFSKCRSQSHQVLELLPALMSRTRLLPLGGHELPCAYRRRDRPHRQDNVPLHAHTHEVHPHLRVCGVTEPTHSRAPGLDPQLWDSPSALSFSQLSVGKMGGWATPEGFCSKDPSGWRAGPPSTHLGLVIPPVTPRPSCPCSEGRGGLRPGTQRDRSELLTAQLPPHPAHTANPAPPSRPLCL